MPTVNNTESLRAWLRQCPDIAKSYRFGADYVGEGATEYALMSVPSNLRYRENILGKRFLAERQEQNFIFAAKVPYGSDVQQNLANMGFFQAVQSWIYEQNAAGNFPEWDNGTIYAIECSNTGAPIQTGANEARYQFQIKVLYKIKESE